MRPTLTKSLALAAVLAAGLSVSGCATKKFVRQTVSPVDTRVSQVEKTSQQHTSAISDLENSVKSTDEKAIEANKNALAAGQSAERANQAATAAGQRADEARTLAQNNTTQISEFRTDVKRTIENLDNYKMVSNEAVLFRLNSAELSKEAKEKLDQVGQNMSGMRRYIVEVEGYTDPTGSVQYNLALSQRRADAVIRYLMTKHGIPLRNIHVIGLGEEAPLSLTAGMAAATPASTTTTTSADRTNERASTKLSRKDARRVEIKLFTPDTAGGQPMQSRTGNPGL